MCWDFNVTLMRQTMFLLAACLTTFTMGVFAAFPSVLNPAILAPDSNIDATPDQASWITACFGLSAIPALAVIPSIFEMWGRKPTNIIINVIILVGCVIQYVANDVYTLALSRLFQGLSIPGLDTFSIGLSECISPKRRGYFIVLNKISVGLGALACHTLGLVLNWRHIAILSTIPISWSIILSVVVCESPAFYAFTGQFDKCIKSFEWYRGNSLTVKKELEQLVVAQTENFRAKQREKTKSLFVRTKNTLMSKNFQKTFFIVVLAKLSLDLCGRHFILTYISYILVEIIKNQSLAMYLSAISDILLVSALCVSCFLVKRFNRRTLLFKLGFSSAFLMFIVSLSLILANRLNLSRHTKWLTPSFILLHLFITHIGLVPIAFTLSNEVFSLEHRGVGLFSSGIVSLSFYSLIMKITPKMIEEMGVEGVYLIYGSCLLLCLLILRIIFIETKDKTLQQIEDELKEINRIHTETELMNCS